jgi:outer membrane protein
MDPYNNQLSSIFYGHPLTDEVLGVPLHMYLTAGFIWHWKSSVQQSTQEVVLAMKAYFVVPWPIRWRIGMAEGFSYVKEIPYVEQEQYDTKDYRPSYLLNYLDFSLDFNIGDIFDGEQLKRMWFGYSVHHRSGIFESNQLFGRVNVGSNYPSLYLQIDF